MTRFSIGLILPLVALAAASVATPSPGESRRIPLSYDEPELSRIGELDWRGGIELSEDDDRFGGLSALEIASDGTTLLAITDRGDWVRFELAHDSRGHLVSARRLAQARLTDVDGRPLHRKQDRDAESLARLPDGSLVVTFEQRHRLLRYPAATPEFSTPPQQLASPPGLRGTTSNGGLEAVTAYTGGLLALTEKHVVGEGAMLGWTGEGQRWRALRYQPAGSFQPTGATTLPNGDMVILERRFSALGGFAVRLVRVRADDVEAAARDFGLVLQGEEIGRLEPPINVDNFEGIAAYRTASGETLLYLISDDNFFALQRTLLIAFAIREAAEPKTSR